MLRRSSMNEASRAYPVTLRGELTLPPNRGLWLVKWLLAIPHYICFIGLFIAYFVVGVIAFFAILFTGKYPKSLFDFNVGVLRWAWRVTFYAFVLGTDKYPPFSLQPDPNYPANLDVPYPEKLSRGLIWVKWWLLAIPHYLVVGFFSGGWGYGQRFGLWNLLAFFAGVRLLFYGEYHKDIFKLVVGMNRWVIRVATYVSLMRDEYPPFRLWDD
jgi:hypothetical protein